MKKFLPVVEKFHSLQGEGFHTGKSAFFIRLAGCEVGCPWCDTKKSWSSTKFPLLSIATLIDEIKRAREKGASFLVITGGEPLEHNLDDFCKVIKSETISKIKKSIKIHIETSGVNKISGFYDWITLSPKRHKPPKEYFLRNCNEIKIIINDKKDVQFAIDIRDQILNLQTQSNEKSEKKFFVQPAWQSNIGFSLAIEFAKSNPKWSLSLQTHKYLSIQ